MGRSRRGVRVGSGSRWASCWGSWGVWVMSATCALWLCACCLAPERPSSSTSAPAVVEVKSDVEALSRLMTIPAGVSQVRWTRMPMGNPDSMAPGPSDYRVIAYLQVPDEAWAEVSEAIGGVQSARRLSMPLKVARALLPEGFELPEPDERGRVNMTLPRVRVEGFERGGVMRGSFAYKVDGGLLVSLTTL